MSETTITPEQLAAYERDGYLIVRELFDAETMSLLSKVSRADKAKNEGAHLSADASGKQSKIWLDSGLSDDMYSKIACSPRIVDPLEQMFGEPALHFHHKMMQKEPRVGGAWEWHQDYGYWYRNERFLFPHMASCMVAVDQATKANGCLQVLRGSHHCGRIEHGDVAGQTGANAERVEALKEKLELVYVEMQPGDGLFFHSNTLHSSAANNSDDPRWVFICCYTAKSNVPLREGVAERLLPPERVSDEAIIEVGQARLHELQPTS